MNSLFKVGVNWADVNKYDDDFATWKRETLIVWGSQGSNQTQTLTYQKLDQKMYLRQFKISVGPAV